MLAFLILISKASLLVPRVCVFIVIEILVAGVAPWSRFSLIYADGEKRELRGKDIYFFS